MACIEQHIQTCLDKGILTTERIRKYPLRTSNLYAFIKAYSIYTYKPFRYNTRTLNKEHGNKYYLTNEGLELLYSFIKSHSLDFNRKIFPFTFARTYDRDAVLYPEKHYRLGNFRGEIGDTLNIPGTKQGGVVREYINPRHSKYVDKEFATLKEARTYLNHRLRYKSTDYFELYRIRKLTYRKKDGTISVSHCRVRTKIVVHRYTGFSPEAIQKGLQKFEAYRARQKEEMQHDLVGTI